jgi:tetratricopeptide (TPR) repeat protein
VASSTPSEPPPGAADDPPTGPAVGLEERARRCYRSGDLEGSIAAWEQLHTALLATGDPIGAARAAAMVATHLLIDTGLMAPVRGWARRAERLLEPHGEVPLLAMISAIHAYERFLSGDLAAAAEHADRAIVLGERHGVADATLMGETARARVTLLQGRLDEGLGLLEEVGARLMAGEADPLVTGMMLCEVICAAQGLALHDVAQEWTEAMARWGDDAAIGSVHGRCRVHRAELLRMSGPCDAAEEEALGACDELRPWLRREFGWPLVELGLIRLRRGDLDGAEESFREAQDHSWDPQPGLALVHLARGEVDRAATEVAAAIAHPSAVPSKEHPPFGDLRLAPLLAAQAEVAAAAGDPATAGHAADRLTRIAAAYPSRSLAASAALARARAALLADDLAAAAAAAIDAVAGYGDIGAPYESATARLVLADVHARAGRDAASARERDSARRALVAFGVTGGTALSPEAPPPEAPPPEAPLPAAPRGSADGAASFADADGAVFSREGSLRTIRFAGAQSSLPDLTGFRYLERLLAEPSREFHVLDLVGATGRPDRLGVQQGIPVIDDQAREAYRRRLVDVEEDIEEALLLNDRTRLELAERDREYLVAELTRAVGLHGRARTTGGTAERARTSVARATRYALRRLADQHPLAAAHLQQAIRTGTYCSYQPDPVTPVRWTVRVSGKAPADPG